jgi:hypothetical protein
MAKIRNVVLVEARRRKIERKKAWVEIGNRYVYADNPSPSSLNLYPSHSSFLNAYIMITLALISINFWFNSYRHIYFYIFIYLFVYAYI